MHEQFISGIDYTPTILEAVGLSQIEGVDGRSFVPLLRGAAQAGREQVFTMFHETSTRQRFEMRAVQDRKYGYIFNAWSDGERVSKNKSQNGLTFRAMQQAARTDPQIAERVKLFLYRVPEEFYDFESDPDALDNLTADPKYKPEMDRLRRQLLDNMRRSGDPLLEVFSKRVKL